MVVCFVSPGEGISNRLFESRKLFGTCITALCYTRVFEAGNVIPFSGADLLDDLFVSGLVDLFRRFTNWGEASRTECFTQTIRESGKISVWPLVSFAMMFGSHVEELGTTLV